jgi:ABC-type branched-subunit amino acid transport system ATPase component
MDIRLDDLEYRHLPRQALRSLISYVAQQPFIFPGTIEENIRVGNPTATRAEVVDAARAAGLFMYDVPKSLESEEGSSLMQHRTAARLKPWERNRVKETLEFFGSWAYSKASSAWRGYHGASSSSSSSSLPAQPRLLASSSPLSSPSPQSSTSPQSSPSVMLPRHLLAPLLQPSTASLLERVSNDESLRKASSVPPDDDADDLDAGDELPSPRVIDELLSMKTDARGGNLSGGFAQSVALARVFLRRDAQLIILDEAMGQMDAIKKRETILPRLLAFARERNAALVIVSHDLRSVCPLVDRVVVMENGSIMQQGSHLELVESYAQPYMRLMGL